MSRTVWKFPLQLADRQVVRMPAGAMILHVGAQLSSYQQVCLWVEVDPDAEPVEDRAFTVVGTGHLVPDDGWWVGTVVTHQGELVWHVYEVPA